MDTDPEVVRTATRGSSAAALGAGETLMTPLSRPSHYLKPRDGRPSLSSWLNPRLVYRIPRSQVTTGVRALGRLAFCDNYRAIIRRLQLELDEILDPSRLQNAARTTRLGLRTNRPRVYLVTSLGGGTGSGMFIDLAYNVRALLRQMGYENPDVVGLLLLPPVDGSRTRLMNLGNTHAALKELHHYGSPGVRFQARYHDREAPICDSDPPFSRNVLLPLPDEGDEIATQEVVEQGAQFLFRDLVTPLGKAADLGRAGLPCPTWEQRGQFFQTFGLFQLAWPRYALVNAVSRRLCQQVVQRWLTKDSKPIRTEVQAWVGDQWTILELGPDHFIHTLQAELIKALGHPPDSLFAATVDPLVKGSAQGENILVRAIRVEPRMLSPEMVARTLADLEELVGSPDDDNPSEPPRLLALLRDLADRVSEQWGQKMAELPVHLIEEPYFRLAGAEEGIRVLVATIEQALQRHESLAQELTGKAIEAYEYLRVAAGRPPRAGFKLATKTPEQIVRLSMDYPKWRLQSQMLYHLAAAFVGLRGHLSDELREVNFCRVRLAELLRSLEEEPADEKRLGRPLSKQGAIGRFMFVDDCKDLSEAVERFMEGFTPAALLELDGRMETMLQANFTALVHVCLANQNILQPVEKAMLSTAGDYALEHLPTTSVAGLFLERYPEPSAAASEVGDFYHQASPELSLGRSPMSGPPSVELTILAAPADPAGERFREVLQRAVPEVEVQTAGSPDDVLIYRERLNLPLLSLEHMGSLGLDAYNQMNSTEHFTPHSRTDVDFR
jgi:hypothetical protein